MANSFFQFKQFTVQQQKAAMKVTTDACLFGSLFLTLIKPTKPEHSVLDIGTGTGLLSLMYAQQFPLATIDAAEIEELAFEQAKENFDASPWSHRLQAIHADIVNFRHKTNYDVIISNPPFYEHDLKSPDNNKNTAHHGTQLKLSDLLSSFDRLVKDGGQCLVLLPYQRAAYFKLLASEKEWYCNNEILVRQSEKHSYFRSILLFSRTVTAVEQKEITIRICGSYSDAFTDLLAPFYL